MNRVASTRFHRQDIEQMYLVNCLGGFTAGIAEAFSSTVGGDPEVVLVYDRCPERAYPKVREFASRHDIPIVDENANAWTHSEDTRGERPAIEEVSKVTRIAKVQIYVDGSCSGNPGPGGWAAILTAGSREREVVGGTTETTNNRAELQAVIIGLEALKYPCEAVVMTDSQYVLGVLSLGWKRKANLDLLTRLDELMAVHDVSFVKVESGDAFNAMADRLAKAETQRQKTQDFSVPARCVGCPELDDNTDSDCAFCHEAHGLPAGIDPDPETSADPPDRVDFRVVKAGTVVTEFYKGQNGRSIARRAPYTLPTIEEALARFSEGYTIRKWKGGARAWLGDKIWRIRGFHDIQRMRRNDPCSQLDFAFEG